MSNLIIILVKNNDIYLERSVTINIRLNLTLLLNLTIDLTVYYRNSLYYHGFIHLRVWFPAFPGVVMLADQELILMCRPPEPTLLRHKAAGFAGTL